MSFSNIYIYTYVLNHVIRTHPYLTSHLNNIFNCFEYFTKIISPSLCSREKGISRKVIPFGIIFDAYSLNRQ